MSHLELTAQQANQLLEQRKRQFIETRVLIQQWCAQLVQKYMALTDDVRAKLPPLPGNTPETMIPSLFVADPADLNVDQYHTEEAVLKNIQQEMNKLAIALNQEAIKCLSDSTLQS